MIHKAERTIKSKPAAKFQLGSDDEDDDAGENGSPEKGSKGSKETPNLKRRRLEDQAEKEKGKEQKKELAAIRTQNTKMQVLASKTLTALASGTESLE